MRKSNIWCIGALAVGIAGFVLLSTSPIMAQGLRPKIGGGLRGGDHDKQAEEGGEEPAEHQPADTSPAAESYHKGTAALDKGETDAAIALFNQAIELDPKYAPAYCDRGLALTIKGELDKAVADLTTAIKLAPGGARSYFNRGFAYFQKGDYDKAVADYSDAIRLAPQLRRGVPRPRLRPHPQGRSAGRPWRI